MKISKTMENAINKQIMEEFESAFLYLSMSTWFSENNLPGFANWCYVQFLEEQEHAMKFHKYILDRQGNPIIDTISKPKSKWKDPIDVFSDILGHETKISMKISDLYSKAKEENDYTSMSFLNWYLNEQVEEEEQSADILNKLRMNSDSKPGLMFLDSTLSNRKK